MRPRIELLFGRMAATVVAEDIVGDKSPKSKQRDQKQKSAEKAKSDANAKAKQSGYSHAPDPSFQGRK